MTPEQKKRIDEISQVEMARIWRFAPAGEPLLQGDTGKYFAIVFHEKGGFTPLISKGLGLCGFTATADG